jgi:putative oxidoreductase
MFSPIRAVLTVLARLLLCTPFAAAAVHHATDFNGTVAMMEQEHVPEPKILLVGAIAFLALGSLSVILGFRARIGALLLLIFLAAVTYYFHHFWTYPEGSNEKAMQMGHFMSNLAFMGAMLFIIANGPGPASFDSRRAVNRPITTP